MFAVAVFVVASAAWADIPASAYVQTGLVGHWDGIENAGAGTHDNAATAWSDLAGGIGDATRMSDKVVWQDDCWTNGVDGAPFEVDSDFAKALSTKCFTLEVRVRPTRTSDRETIIGNYNKGQNFNLEHNGASPTGCFRFFCNNAPNWGAPATVAADEAASATFVAPADGYPIAYKNGTLAGTHNAKITASMAGNHGTIFGGEYNRANMAFRGAFYSVRLYNRALTPDEISINANIDKIRFEGVDPATLTWPAGYRWNASKGYIEYQVSVQGADGAPVSIDGETFAESVATAWTEFGTPVAVTVSARPPQGCSISAWEGVPTGVTAVRNANSITLTLAEAAALNPVVHTCQTLHWRGTTDASASKPANWVDGEGNPATSAPLTGDAIVIDEQSTNQAMTWDLDEVIPASWTQSGWSGTVTFMTGSVGRKAKNVAKVVHGVMCDGGTNVELHVSGDVMVMSGKWTVTANPSFNSTDAGWLDGQGVYRLLVRVGGDFTVGEGATLDVISRGFQSRQGPGYSTASVNGQPGAHGGGAQPMNSGKLMPCYGDAKAPVTIGSSGGGGLGGGAIRIFVNGCTRIDGALDASTTPSVQWYGSSGGSVYLKTGTLMGQGRIAANGQQATSGGSGGGGRVALVLTDATADFTAFTGDVSAYGGYTSETNMGSPGTIYREKPADEGKGTLIVRGINGKVTSPSDLSRGITAGLTGVLGPSAYEFSEIIVTNGASLGISTNVTVEAAKLTGYNRDTDHVTLHGGTLVIPTGLTVENLAIGSRERDGGRVEFSGAADGERGKLTIGAGGQIGCDKALVVDGDLEIADGGRAWHTANSTTSFNYYINLTVHGDMTIEAGGIVDARAGGYRANFGRFPGNNHSYGGSYGGKAYNAPDRRCYGSIKRPSECGSGPGYSGRSGGCIRLSVDGDLTVNGAVDATTQIATGWTGGGAGGSVWISARSLAGSGEINANGGHVENNGGECGGGGRIAVELTGEGATFADCMGMFHAQGGREKKLSGQIRGGAGTIYLRTADEDPETGGTLIIDGGRTSGSCAATEITTDVTDTSFDTVIITNGASLKQYQDTTITVRKDWLNSGTYAAEIADAEHAAGMVVFTNAAVTSRIVGVNPFAALTCVTPGKRLEFGTGANDALTIVEGGKLTIIGVNATGECVTLRPATENETWMISIADGASAEMDGLDVASSDASSSPTKPVAKNSVDSGDNVDWNFVNIHEGEVITWTGVRSSSWNQPDNWDLQRVPVATDKIVIPTGASNVPTFNEPLTLAKLTVESGAVLDLATYGLTMTGELAVNGKMLARNAETIELQGAFVFAPDSFDCARSTLVLAGTDARTADFGGNVFWDIRFGRDGTTTTVTGGFTAQRVWAQPTAASTLAFEQGVSIVAHEWWLGGVDGETPLLTLTSATVARPWSFTAIAHAWVRGIKVRDSNASGGNAVYAQAPCEDLTGNVNWRLGVGAAEWTGADGTAFENPANWSTGKVPGADDLAVLGEGATVVVADAGATVGELHVEGESAVSGGRLTTVGSAYVRGGELTLDALLAVGQDLDVRSDGKITHTKNGTAEGHRVDISVARDLYVWGDGQIHANAKGYSSGQGPGRPSGTSAGSSHGGRGSGVCYGSFRHPTESGSGGGSWNSAGTAWGGGVIYLSVKGTTTVDGGVTANGERKAWYGPSGGSVYLSTRFLAGNGTISANGGNLVNGGLGGGGRVAVYLTDAQATFDDFKGAITAYGGRSDATSSGVGGAGTVFKSLATDPEDGGTLILDNGNVAAWDSGSRGGGADFPLIDEVDRRQNANLKVVIGQFGHLVSRGPITVKEVEMSDSTGKLNLNGQPLSILSTAHRSRKKAKDALGHWQGDWPGTVDYSVEGSTILWGRGFLLFVR